MKVSKIKRIIQEEIQNVSPKQPINEGFVDKIVMWLFSGKINNATKQYASDPEVQALYSNFNQTREKMAQRIKELEKL